MVVVRCTRTHAVLIHQSSQCKKKLNGMIHEILQQAINENVVPKILLNKKNSRENPFNNCQGQNREIGD